MAPIADIAHLEGVLSAPTDGVIETLARLTGDIVILGASGKMGPTLARMARRASDQAGIRRRIYGVARFTDGSLAARLESWGIDPIRCDLLDGDALARLPDAPNVVFMTGMKFGSTGQEARTWAMNCWLPALVCQRYRQARIAAFSTGNVYGLSPVALGGSLESDTLNAAGDYAMSCVGRERMFEHFSRMLGIPMTILRLNYAVELRYGVLVDLAQRVLTGEPIDRTMGHFNAIWQADANAMALASLGLAESPPLVLNIAGPETLSVRRVATEFGRRFDRPVALRGTESADALLSNGQRAHRLFGYPRISSGQVIDAIADWLLRGGETLGKPTHFEVRDGKF